MEYILRYAEALAGLTMEMAPYLMLGFLFAGILYGWFPRNKIYKYLGKPNSASVINASLIGIPLPLCSCGVIPTGISFYKSGASRGSSVSFLISTPQTGVDSIMVSYSLLGLPLAIIKPFIALYTGFLGGFLTNKFDHGRQKEVKDQGDMNSKGGNSYETVEESIPGGEKNGKADKSLKGMLRFAFVEFLEDIAKWLFIGLVLAAFIEVLVPESFFTAYLGNEYLEMLLILVAAVPLYVCATGSVPIAAVLMLKGLSPGAAIVFLMAGPATNAATMTVIGNVFGRRTLILYLVSIIAGAYFSGIMVNEFLPREWFLAPLSEFQTGLHTHGLLPDWVKIGSGLLLGVLILHALYRKYVSRYVKSKIKQPKPVKTYNDMKNLDVIVKGMTCNHCKATVENNVSAMEGVEVAKADLATEKLNIQGENINLEKLKEKVESLGYRFEGLSE
jgi:uncharacterized membrane protein YraQ (UPF0718 family)/copper chaperone CopZ